jgi:diaminopimelate epimerase
MTQRAIPFVKASACGNDFLIVDGVHAGNDLAGMSRRLCDRHEGIGADGVEWLYSATDTDIECRLINADGSAAEVSGNGTRCVAAHIVAATGKEKVGIRTGAGVKLCFLTERHDPDFEFATAMGRTQVGTELKLALPSRQVLGIPVSTGNPHFVMFVEDFPSGWQELAAEIGKDRHFAANGVNVEFVRVPGRGEIEIRIFERGAGETMSSGTGSCASACAAIATGRAVSPVTVRSPGGAQSVVWEGGEVTLQGPARLLARGEFFL